MASVMAWALRRTAPLGAGDAGAANPVSSDTVSEAGNVAVLATLLVLLLIAMGSMALQWSVDGLREPQGIASAQD